MLRAPNRAAGRRRGPGIRSEVAGGGGGAVFWRYWSASTINSVGAAVASVALPLTAVVLLRASSFEVGLLTAARYVAWIAIGLPAGLVVSWAACRCAGSR